MVRYRVSLLVVAALVWTSFCAAGVAAGKEPKKRGSVLFYAGFDRGKNADYAVGNPKAKFHEGGGSLNADGRGFRGSALRSGDGEGYLEYSAKGNINAKRGSIEFWMYAEDWEHDDGHVHRLIDVSGTGGIDFRIRQPGVQELIIRDTTGQTSRYANTAYGCNPLKGKWSWYALTWEKGKPLGFYIGGIKASGKAWSHDSSGRAILLRPPKKLLKILIGDFGGIPQRRAHTLIDEVYIYDRQLTREEVTWATENALTRKPGMDIPVDFMKPKVRVVPNPAKNTLVVEIDSGDRRGKFSGKSRLEPASGTSAATITPTKGRFGQAVIPYTNLPQGEYKVISDITNQNKLVASVTTKFIVPGPPVWLKKKVGVSDTPPPPWTPVTVNGNRASVWGRNYSLGTLGLPAKVETQKASLLAGPISFRATAGGTDVTWTKNKRVVDSRTAAQVVWKGSSLSAVGKLNWRTQLEYDGFQLHDLSLTPAQAAKVELMELRIPIRKEFALLYSQGSRKRGFLPKGTGKILGAGGYWWIGTDDFGLCGATEHNGALVQGGAGSFSIVREPNGDVTVVYRFVAKPTSLSETWKLRLILQATPTKPLPANWRTWRDASPFTGPTADYYLKWRDAVNLWVAYPWPNKTAHKSFAFPIVKDSKWYRDHVKNLQAGRPVTSKKKQPPAGKKKRFANSVLPYSMLAFMAPGMPESDFYWRDWHNPLGFSSLGGGLYQYAAVRPVPSYIDFMVWKHRELIRKYGHDGLYVDFAGLCQPALGVKHGLGYERRGIRYPATMPVVANREIWKRVYTMLRKENPNSLIVGHVSENTCVPILSFCDVWINGEGNWFGQLKDDYLGVLPLDQLRAEFRSQHFGGVPWWLPAWQRAAVLKDKDVAVRRKDGSVGTVSVEKTHHMLGIGLLLDIPVWPITGTNSTAARQLYAVQDEFGMGDVKFFGYWNNSKLIGGQTDGIKASVYKKPKRGALAVIYNTTRKTRTTKLTMAWDQLKSATPLKVVDAYTKRPIAVSGRSLTLKVPPLNYRLVWVR